MPTYEYKCEKCANEFEEFQSISAQPLTDCPESECDGKVKKLISLGAGFVLKGTGYYQTDFKNKGKPEKSKPTTNAEPVKPVKKDI